MTEIKVRIVLEDYLSDSIEKPIEKVNKLKEALNSLDNAADTMAGKKLDINNNEALEKIKGVKSKLENLVERKFSPVIAAIDATKEVARNVKSVLSSLSKKPTELVIKAVDKTKDIISKAKESIMNFKGSTTVKALELAGKYTIGQAAQLEPEEIAIKHSIGYKNQGIGQSSIQQMANGFIDKLKAESNSTVFNTNELLTAGRSALNITNGDTNNAIDIVKLSENMAALNPGKSVKDAMEALADLKTGQTDKINKFGIKISEDDIKKGGGADSYFKKQTTSGGSVGKAFAGGADELGKTAGGQWLILTGKLQNIGTNVGQAFLPIINKVLTPLSGWLDKNLNKFSQFGTEVVKVGSKISTALAPFINTISTKLGPVIMSMVNTVKTHIPDIVKYFQDMWVKIKPSLQNLWQTIQEHVIPIIQDIWGKVQAAMPGIQSLFKAAFDIAVFAIKGAIGVFDWVAPKIQFMWDTISPVLNLVIDIFNKVAKAIEIAVGWLSNWNGTDSQGALLDDKTGLGKGTSGKDARKLLKGEALGTSYFSGGLTWVGETGPELVQLSAGSKVYNNRESKNMMGSGINVAKLADQIVVREDADIDKIVSKLVSKLTQIEPNMA